MGGLHREIRLGVSRRVLLRSITAFSALVLVVSCKPVQCVRMCCLSEACPKILTQRVGVRAEFRGALSCPCKPFKKRCCVAHWHFDHPRSTKLVWIGRVATQQWCFRFPCNAAPLRTFPFALIKHRRNPAKRRWFIFFLSGCILFLIQDVGSPSSAVTSLRRASCV